MSGTVMLLGAFTLTLALTLVVGEPLIAWLHRLKYGQTAYEDAPQTHAVKTGTPTMGGLLFLIPLAVALVFRHDIQTLALALLGLGCGTVGFIDDYTSIRRGRNRGLGGRAKFGATAVIALAFLAIAVPAMPGDVRGVILEAGRFHLTTPPAVFVPLALLAILATTHAVNLTDGLDDLAGGTIVPPLILFTVLAIPATPAVAISDIALVAAVLGFLTYNRHPAHVFMGDTGALALGGLLAGSAILTGNLLLLPIVGGVFAAEALSVIVQVAYFKRTGKRVFRMSPLHHHFELGGWPETKVTYRFWTVSALLSLAGAAIVR